MARSVRSICRRTSSTQTRSLNPNVTGSAWIPWVRPIQGVFLYFRAWRFRTFSRALEPGEDPLQGFPDQEREGRVDDIVGGQADVDEPAVRADLLVDRGQEGDDVVLDDLLDLVDPLDREAGLGLDRLQGGRGDLPEPGPGLADGELDVEPSAVPVLFGPDAAHLGECIAFDHRSSIPSGMRARIITISPGLSIYWTPPDGLRCGEGDNRLLPPTPGNQSRRFPPAS